MTFHASAASLKIGPQCRSCPAARAGFCAAIDPSARSKFSARVTKTVYLRGDEIIAQGATAGRMGVVASGLVKISARSEAGDEFLLQVLRPGQFVGEPGAEPSEFSWDAATDAAVCWANVSVWEDFLHELGEEARPAYLRSLAAETSEARRAALMLRGRNTLQRVAVWLLDQASRLRPDRSANRPPLVRIVLSRRDLASLLDMTVETLCRSLRQLDTRGLIEMQSPDEIEIHDIPGLCELAQCRDDRLMAMVTDQSGPRRAARSSSGFAVRAAIAGAARSEAGTARGQ